MNALEKIKKSWWVILSFIIGLNGFGFIYIALRHNNKHWLLEGIMYEIPWFLYFIFFAMFGAPDYSALSPSYTIIIFALLLQFVSIVRSFWVAVKLADVYDNEEKYTIQTTVLKKPVNGKNNNDLTPKAACCVCIFVIFVIFVIIAF